MIAIRPTNERGAVNLGWLDSKHTFSFGNYYDPNHISFASLRVINEDKVQPSKGFGTHGHKDMEIVTYVLEGKLEHKDNIGNSSIIRPGEVQRMSAGTGILHSEYNPSDEKSVHFLQIWIFPNQNKLEPSYEQKMFGEEETRGKLRLVGSQEGREGSVTIHQDVNLYATSLAKDEAVHYNTSSQRKVWVQVARGAVTLNNRSLETGDGAAISEEDSITLQGMTDGTEVLLFDMA
ncbi:pirin family protein [Lusitaniella coriacea]|uniref:pirin family protein n=1 Tax=Lusitaniella coriacea TaxID=1983105 RepID=UPI003CF73EE7